MKQLFKVCVLLMGFVFGLSACQDDYDDAAIRQDIENIQSEIEAIKADLATLKGQVNSIQTLVDAHKDGKVVTQIEELPEGDGYKITFNDATSITVLKYTGEKPASGSVLGVQELEGTYYWTVVTDGNAALLLDDKGEKVPVSGAKVTLSLDELGYWTLNGKRIVDANEDFIRFKKGDSSALFKDIVVDEGKITFILADDSEIVVNKKTETFLRFKSSFVQVENSYRPNNIPFEYSSDLSNLKIVEHPEGWNVNIHLPNKAVNVILPEDCSFTLGEIVLQALDKNGLVYTAVVKVGVKGKGFCNEDATLILNEGNMTTENGSLIYIDGNGTLSANVYESMNGTQLGNVTQDLYIYNKKIYFISQNGTRNAVGAPFVNDGMLVVANSETLKKEASYEAEFSAMKWPTHVAVLNEENVFIRDMHGIFRFNTSSRALILVEGTQNADKRTMAVADGKVFAVLGSKLLVLEKDQDKVSKTLEMEWPITGVLKAEDGNLFVSTQEYSTKANKIAKINSKTYEVIKENAVELGSVSAGYGATPGITAIGDILYYSGADKKIYRHNFTTGESKFMVDVETEVENANIVYNNIAVHPKTGRVYINTIKGYGFNYLTNNISVFKPEGDALVLEENYENYTRFPAGIFFPANF